MRPRAERAALAAQACDTPRVRVAALLLREGKVVTVRHRSGRLRYHLLPGGGVSWGETLAGALTREVAEETGLAILVGAPVLLSDTIDPSGRRHVVNIVFAAEVTGGAITPCPVDSRVEAVDLVDPAELSSLDLRPPLAAEILAILASGEGGGAVYAGSPFTPETSGSGEGPGETPRDLPG